MAGTSSDQYFIIAQHGDVQVPYTILVTRPCTKKIWEEAPGIISRLQQSGIYDRVLDPPHGRRLNDEVELFCRPDGKVSKLSEYHYSSI